MNRPNGLEFEGTARAVGSLALASNPAGLILGHDQSGVPVTLQPFRAEPTRILLIDQGWLERVLVLRALAVGARVVMQTPDAQLWSGFGESATGVGDRFHVAPPYQSVTAPGSVSRYSTIFPCRRLAATPAARNARTWWEIRFSARPVIQARSQTHSSPPAASAVATRKRVASPSAAARVASSAACTSSSRLARSSSARGRSRHSRSQWSSDISRY